MGRNEIEKWSTYRNSSRSRVSHEQNGGTLIAPLWILTAPWGTKRATTVCTFISIGNTHVWFSCAMQPWFKTGSNEPTELQMKWLEFERKWGGCLNETMKSAISLETLVKSSNCNSKFHLKFQCLIAFKWTNHFADDRSLLNLLMSPAASHRMRADGRFQNANISPMTWLVSEHPGVLN